MDDVFKSGMETLRVDVSDRFKPDRFATGRRPVRAGILPGEIEDLPSCLDMLVMLPGGLPTLPHPYRQSPAVIAFLQIALNFETQLLPGWQRTHHLYLTVDRRQVRAGGTHRNAGWHFDGMQGGRYQEKLPACHQYVVSDALPTEFSDCPSDATGLDEMRHNWFEALGDQVPADRPVLTPQPYEIMCMSAYQLHRSPVATEDTWRTFMRLDVSVKQQDRQGNTANPDLPAPFAFVPRSLPEGLGRPIQDASWRGSQRFGAS